MHKEALLYNKSEDSRADCFLCNHYCKIKEGKSGFCGVRQNNKGTLYTNVYGSIIAQNIDPIEKKPLFHMLPGSKSFSIATVGCNFRCGFCQNWQISQTSEAMKSGIKAEEIQPVDIVQSAKKYGCKSISYTYTEPTVFFEYALDTAKIAKENGLYNVFVTNGYMTADALNTIKPYLDACNVDLKAFSDEFYRQICSARLNPVLDSIRLMKKLNIWVEITTLLIPGKNDSETELGKIAGFIKSVGEETPWHISRFHPDYKFMRETATPVTSLRKAMEIGINAGLKYVYIGNILQEGENTYCYKCKKEIVKRTGFSILEYKINDSKCGYCGANIDGIFSDADIFMIDK